MPSIVSSLSNPSRVGPLTHFLLATYTPRALLYQGSFGSRKARTAMIYTSVVFNICPPVSIVTQHCPNSMMPEMYPLVPEPASKPKPGSRLLSHSRIIDATPRFVAKTRTSAVAHNSTQQHHNQ